MNQFDEYQKLMRYKYGYHSFFIIVALSIINFNLELFYDIQWAETKELETMVIIMIAIMYSLVMYVYKGAYFAKWESPIFFSIIFFILGIVNINSSFSPYSPLISNGRITSNIFIFLGGIVWLAIPITYLVKLAVEKRRDSKDIDEE